VVGDTVGDPFKDTAGPSLHVVIKLLSTITLVLAPLFIKARPLKKGKRKNVPLKKGDYRELFGSERTINDNPL
jgi:hypothetical protein